MKVIAIGDVHGEWGQLNDLINRRKPEIVLQCGDFGYFPAFPEIHGEVKGDARVMWCDGNHDDHWALRDGVGEPVAGAEYQRRGTFAEVAGMRVLFMGGALSIDQDRRIMGVSWWPDELISVADMARLPDIKEGAVDLVVSHTCPWEFKVDPPFSDMNGKLLDPSRRALSEILRRYRPRLWVFGHWHRWSQGNFEGTEWRCLNMLSHSDRGQGPAWVEIDHHNICFGRRGEAKSDGRIKYENI